MSTHVLPVWPSYFMGYDAGSCRFTVHRPDRDFATGDVVWLVEWHPFPNECTGRALKVVVSSVLHLAALYGLEADPGAGVVAVDVLGLAVRA